MNQIPRMANLQIMGASLLAICVSGCGGGSDSALTDHGTPKPEYAEAVAAAAAAGVMATCDSQGEVTFLDFHAHPDPSNASVHVKQFPNLKMLNFSSSKLTDADLPNLAGASKLEELGLHGTQVTDEGMQHLAGLTSLRQLNLTDTSVGDAGLAKLVGLTSLVRIDLQNTKVTDAGLAHLDGMKDLVWIQLSNTPVTDAAAEALQAQFPDAQITNETIEEMNLPFLPDSELPDQ